SLEQASEVVGAGVSPADLALLHARTEGWAVALQLARLWLDRGRHRLDALKDFSGRTTEMTDYLAEQIVAGLPGELRGGGGFAQRCADVPARWHESGL